MIWTSNFHKSKTTSFFNTKQSLGDIYYVQVTTFLKKQHLLLKTQHSVAGTYIYAKTTKILQFFVSCGSGLPHKMSWGYTIIKNPKSSSFWRLSCGGFLIWCFILELLTIENFPCSKKTPKYVYFWAKYGIPVQRWLTVPYRNFKVILLSKG